RFDFAPGDRSLQFASISWDTSAEEIFPTLTTGAALVLRTDALLDVGAFDEHGSRMQLTVANLPTAYWHALNERIRSDELAQTLRLTIVGGEAAQKGRVLEWTARFGQSVRLVNTYGATEATAVTTSYELNDLHAEGSEDVPIGRALGPKLSAHVLD